MTAPSAESVQLRLDGLSHAFGTRRVLTDVSLSVSSGQRTALIGENGSGKSTLLRIAAGLLEPDAGSVHLTARARRGLLHQKAPFAPDASVRQALADALAPVHALAEAVDQAATQLAAAPQDPAVAGAYDEALKAAERAGAWETQTRTEQMLAGLGLADLPRERATGALSGGQRSRLALAWLLLRRPDVLLLDEPTNHLDDAATAHLAGVLAGWPGPVLLASHDRAFLDETVTALVDLDPAVQPHAVTAPLMGDGDGSGIGVTRFTGTYTGYLQARLDARERWERQFRDEQTELKRLRASVQDNQQVGHAGRAPRTEARAAKKFYADRNATVVSRRVNDARSRLEDLTARQVRRPPADLVFRGLRAGADVERVHGGAGPVLVASDAAVRGRLRPTSLAVSAGEHWLVTGPNGSGKSTLLQVLAGDLAPSAGTVSAPRSLRVGLLSQDADLPDPAGRGPSRTAAQAYADLAGHERARAVPLGTFGLVAGRDENRPALDLSVGQQRRLALAVVLADPPDVLLLDEPTNHLSLLLVTQLEAAIPAYPGAVVVASHDRWLRRSWSGRHLALAP